MDLKSKNMIKRFSYLLYKCYTNFSSVSLFFRAKKLKKQNIMTTYHINPTVKKRWFKSPQLIYELIKYEEEDVWVDPTYGNGGGDYITVKKETVIFSSPSFEEVEELRNKLNQINKE